MPLTASTPLQRTLSPFREFFVTESTSGLVLMACTVLALAWANSPWTEFYDRLWAMPFTVGVGESLLSKPLLLWINDGLMAVFFFVAGMEIKRELLVGELASPRKAALPVAAALGGMVLPALLYAAVNAGGPGARGWGVPMATDIAFALGVLSLLGSRAPLYLKIFLTAVAIVDDLGAVLVIAVFYTEAVSWGYMLQAGLVLAVLAGLNAAGARSPVSYALLGALLWFLMLKSGVHATVAGVLLALTIPARTVIDAPRFILGARRILDRFEEEVDQVPKGNCVLTNEHLAHRLQSLGKATRMAETPLQRLEHALLPWNAYLVMPVFALANAGVALDSGAGAALSGSVGLGIILGLVIGKPLGVVLMSWLAIRLGLASMPAGGTWRQIAGAGCLAGVGFTMALFVASLAFPDPSALDRAKVAILLASLLSGILGVILLRSGPAPGQGAS
jgi:NhaA family Na+:H+ antiporter